MKKRRCCFLPAVSLLLAMMLAAFAPPCLCAAERGAWDCPACGRTGNTGNFCGGCGSAAPEEKPSWLDEKGNVPLSEISLPTIQEVNADADQLLELALIWTEETAPESLDAFPYFPEYAPAFLLYLRNHPPVLEGTEPEYTLRLPDRPGKILEDYIPAQEWSWRGCELFIMYPSGEDYAENSYPLDENADTVSFSLPDGIDLSTIQVLNLYFNARYAEGMQWVLDPAIYYFVDNDNGIRDIQTRISFYKSGKTIDWIFADDKISVSVLNRVDESSYWLVSARYDAKTGQCIYWNKVLNGP